MTLALKHRLLRVHLRRRPRGSGSKAPPRRTSARARRERRRRRSRVEGLASGMDNIVRHADVTETRLPGTRRRLVRRSRPTRGWTERRADRARDRGTSSSRTRWARPCGAALTPDPGSSSGRTPRSERGSRGSSPCPGASWADSSAGRAPVSQTGGGPFESGSAYSHADSSGGRAPV